MRFSVFCRIFIIFSMSYPLLASQPDPESPYSTLSLNAQADGSEQCFAGTVSKIYSTIDPFPEVNNPEEEIVFPVGWEIVDFPEVWIIGGDSIIYYKQFLDNRWEHISNVNFKMIDVDILYVSACNGNDSSSYSKYFSGSHIFIADSIPLQVGDSIKVEQYYAYLIDPEPWGSSPLNIDFQGHVTINGILYADPTVSISQYHYLKPFRNQAGIDIDYHNGLLHIQNTSNSSKMVVITLANGKRFEHLRLAPFETRILKVPHAGSLYIKPD